MKTVFSINGIAGVTFAILVGLVIYTSLELIFDPGAIVADARPPKVR